MPRVRISLTVTCCALMGATGLVQTSAADAAAARTPTVKLERTEVGKVLVNASGYTLYLFTADKRNQDRCGRVSGCLSIWPALTTKRKPVAGPNVRSSLLGTIKFRGNLRQVTYAGHPLYTYAFDSAPRSTFYVGADEFGGLWLAINAAGRGVN